MLQAWIPLCIYEIGFDLSVVRNHHSIVQPTSKNYLDLVYKFLQIFYFVFIFRTIFFRKNSLTIMLNHIYSTATAMQQHLAKTNKRLFMNLLYIPFGLVFLTETALFIISFVSDFIPDEQNVTSVSEMFYKSFIRRFRIRFYMDISTTSSYTTLDYIIGIYEVVIQKIADMIWTTFDTLHTGVIPLTFTILINQFEEVLHKLALENDTSITKVCRLFDNLKIMSKYINSNWGMTCLIWTIIYSTHHAFNLNVWILSEDLMYLMYAINELVGLALLLYFSGEVHSKVRL